MVLPLILEFGAVITGIRGIGKGINGVLKMKKAKDTMEEIRERHLRNMNYFEQQNQAACKDMDRLGKLELEILKSFSEFSDAFEQIKDRPIFEKIPQNGVELPEYEVEQLKKVSIGAGILLGGLGGAALGTAGGFVAAGMTTAAVTAFGTASTGTAIASLSGAALTNATLAALGGGAVAVGGGGIALGTTILGVTSLGASLLVGGVIFNVVSSKLSAKTNEAKSQVEEAETNIKEICIYLKYLCSAASRYYDKLCTVNDLYRNHLNIFTEIINQRKHTDWKTFTEEEKKIVENTVLLVGLLYNMCKVKLVLKEKDGLNRVNEAEIEKALEKANMVLKSQF